MLAIFSIALVITAGVGMPSGVIGIVFLLKVLPKIRYSMSRDGVYNVALGDAPAILIPGIVEVSVEPMTYRAKALELLILLMNSLASLSR